MSFIVAGGIAAGTALAGIGGALISNWGAQQAAETQAGATNQAMQVQQDQFAKIQEMLAPYAQTGEQSLQAQANLLGLGGPEAQKAMINSIQQSPEMAALMQQGENAILQNASATGGLRGGNTQAALAQFRPQILNQLIAQQFQRLGGLTGIGQAAAAGQAAQGQQFSGDMSNLLLQQGAYRAGGQLSNANMFASIPNAIGQGLGTFAGLGNVFNQPGSGFFNKGGTF